MSKYAPPRQIRLVVFDWAGTTVDHGCFAPVRPFIEALAHYGVEVSVAQAREPMGLEKRDHLRALLQMPEVEAQWQKLRGHAPSEAELNEMYTEQFIPRQMSCVRDASKLVPGMLDCVGALRQRGIKIATTTGYFREAAELAYAAGREQGYDPDLNLNPSDVPAARPAPWMMFRAMETLGVYPPAAVLKIGDTIPDILEGRNAGAWSIGVTRTGSDVGLSEAEAAALPADELRAKMDRAAATLREAGAHAVIDSVAQLPELLGEIEGRLARGEAP